MSIESQHKIMTLFHALNKIEQSLVLAELMDQYTLDQAQFVQEAEISLPQLYYALDKKKIKEVYIYKSKHRAHRIFHQEDFRDYMAYLAPYRSEKRLESIKMLEKQ